MKICIHNVCIKIFNPKKTITFVGHLAHTLLNSIRNKGACWINKIIALGTSVGEEVCALLGSALCGVAGEGRGSSQVADGVASCS